MDPIYTAYKQINEISPAAVKSVEKSVKTSLKSTDNKDVGYAVTDVVTGIWNATRSLSSTDRNIFYIELKSQIDKLKGKF